MQSKIDPTKELVNGKIGVVSLVKTGKHAILIVETLVNNSYSFRKIHFLPAKNTDNYYNPNDYYGRFGFWGGIANSCEKGKIEDYALEGINEKTSKKKLEEILFNKGRKEKGSLRLDKGYYRSWCCVYKDIVALRRNVAEEIDNPPLFQILGNLDEDVKQYPESKGHNCISWALGKLDRWLRVIDKEELYTFTARNIAYRTDDYVLKNNI